VLVGVVAGLILFVCAVQCDEALTAARDPAEVLTGLRGAALFSDAPQRLARNKIPVSYLLMAVGPRAVSPVRTTLRKRHKGALWSARAA
jgi:hypothetical protein